MSLVYFFVHLLPGKLVSLSVHVLAGALSVCTAVGFVVLFTSKNLLSPDNEKPKLKDMLLILVASLVAGAVKGTVTGFSNRWGII